MGENKRNYRITYRRKDGTTGEYYKAAENRCEAISFFVIHTGNPRESVISVEMEVVTGRTWKRID